MSREGSGACVIISDDTDAFFILLLSKILTGHGILHVLNGSVHSVDNAIKSIEIPEIDATSIATLYAFGGCYITPRTTGVAHELYLSA